MLICDGRLDGAAAPKGPIVCEPHYDKQEERLMANEDLSRSVPAVVPSSVTLEVRQEITQICHPL